MNYASMGLTNHSPFDILKRPKSILADHKPKKKSGPKRSRFEWSLISLETPEQRIARQIKEKTDKLLKINLYSESGYNTGKTNSEVAPR